MNEVLVALNNYEITEEQTYSRCLKEQEASNFVLSDIATGQMSLEPILTAFLLSILPVVSKPESHGFDPSKNWDFFQVYSRNHRKEKILTKFMLLNLLKCGLLR